MAGECPLGLDLVQAPPSLSRIPQPLTLWLPFVMPTPDTCALVLKCDFSERVVSWLCDLETLAWALWEESQGMQQEKMNKAELEGPVASQMVSWAFFILPVTQRVGLIILSLHLKKEA